VCCRVCVLFETKVGKKKMSDCLCLPLSRIRLPLSRSVRGGKECVSLYSQTNTHAREGDRQTEKKDLNICVCTCIYLLVCP